MVVMVVCSPKMVVTFSELHLKNFFSSPRGRLDHHRRPAMISYSLFKNLFGGWSIVGTVDSETSTAVIGRPAELGRSPTGHFSLSP